MIIDELIKILENYEIFVDDDYGGSYKSVIAYAPDKKVSRAHTPIGTLKIIDTFEEIHKENQELKKQLETVRKKYEVEAKTRDKVYKMLRRKDSQQKEFIEWLENYIDALKQQKETVEGLDIGEEHILMILEEVLEKYKEIIGVKDE